MLSFLGSQDSVLSRLLWKLNFHVGVHIEVPVVYIMHANATLPAALRKIKVVSLGLEHRVTVLFVNFVLLLLLT